MTTKKVFIVCTTDSMISSFLIPYIEAFQDAGYTVRCFCSRTGNHFDYLRELNIDVTELQFTRNPISFDNLKAYKKLLSIMKSETPDLVFCHEPVGGVMGRLTGHKVHSKVIYMVHGFHFYKGAPIINWLVFYPIEKVMSCFTDILITINSEDYSFAKKHMKARRCEFLPGVGIDIKKYNKSDESRYNTRHSLGFNDDDVVIISVGELNENKNHIAVLKAMNNISCKNVHFVIAGVGDKKDYLLENAELLGLKDNLHLLGYRNDCNNLYAASDIFCFPSFREGLSVALMEAMASSLPVIASNIRGNVDLIQSEGGILVKPDDINEISSAIQKMLDTEYRISCGKYNRRIIEKYSTNFVLSEFCKIVGINRESFDG